VHVRTPRPDLTGAAPSSAVLSFEASDGALVVGHTYAAHSGISRSPPASSWQSSPITIGDVVHAGLNVQLLTPTHPIGAEARRAKWESARPIVIGANVWLGGGVIVHPGVSIGEHTVVGARAVVTRDLPANVVAIGNPARVVRSV